VSVPNPYSGELDPRVGIEHISEVDDTTTHWWEYPSSTRADTLVFVHGFRGDHHGLQLFADALPEYRILIPDMPVFGKSSTWSTGLSSIDDYGRWLRAFLAATQSVDAVVLGHSFGSVVAANALRGARKTPIILVNPISQPALTGPKRVAAALTSLWYAIGRLFPERLGSAWLGNLVFVRAMSEMLTKSHNPPLRRWIHDQHARYFSSYSDRDSLVAAFTVSTNATVADYASQIDAPALLIAAEQDDITPVEAQRAIQRQFPNAELHVLEGVGHLVHYEKPIETAAAIREFLARHST
jgi:pimeloyl-ACP methyl ester carboxylesterase